MPLKGDRSKQFGVPVEIGYVAVALNGLVIDTGEELETDEPEVGKPEVMELEAERLIVDLSFVEVIKKDELLVGAAEPSVPWTW